MANSLNLLSDEILVEYYDPSSFRETSGEILSRWSSFDRVLVAPQLASLLPDELPDRDKIWTIPVIDFNAYHPDILYLRQGSSTFKGPMGDYHSAIAYASFRRGLSISDTAALFNENTYEQLGYFQYWDYERMRLLKKFKQAGLDLQSQFVNWSRDGAFMYSMNHVDVRCLHDVAKEILRVAGKRAIYSDVLPHDNLLNGPVYPIYPEIGQRLGVTGSYHFKLGGQYRFIQLGEFLAKCFDLYSRNPDLVPVPFSRFERAMDHIGNSP
ncbi:hypothetical protein GCM10027432_04030 [Lysobacter fragariae]